jgi:tetratricopeptide (TPR) repeat protein
MKKWIVGVLALFAFTGLKAQDSNVLSAWEYMSTYNSEKAGGNMGVAIENLIRAKEAIDAASLDEKTLGKSKTWKRRAEVYIAIMIEKDPSLGPYKATVIDEIYKSVQKARTVEVNPKNNKPKIFEEDLLISQAYYLCDTLFKSGSARFLSKDYQTAGIFFEKRYTLLKELGVNDTVTFNNMFLSAYNDKSFDKAILIGNQLLEWNSPDPKLYGSMARIYQEKGDAAKGLQVIKDARTKFPQNTQFITEELNFYLSSGDNANAVKVIDEAIVAFADQKDMLKELYFNSGVLYSQLGDIQKSREFYQKTLQIDSDYYGALNNFAAILLDEANVFVKEANQLPLNETKKYDELKKKADGLYAEAAQYLEKAYAKNPNEKLKAIILEIYIKLKDEAKVAQYK